MNIALFGGTGFIGNYIVDELLERDQHLKLLVRPGSESKTQNYKACAAVSGTITDADAVNKVINDCDAVIYNIGIIREFPLKSITYENMHLRGARRVIDCACDHNVKRFLLMSANGVKPDGTGYQKTKYEAEKYLRESGLNWTILRPSVVFGDPHGQKEFCTEIRDNIIRLPFPAPLFYSGFLPVKAGNFKLSPTYAGDVASAFATALADEASIGKTLSLCGSRTLDWRTILVIIAEVCGKKKLTIPVPVSGIKLMALLFDRFPFFPITRDQITMLMEGNTCEQGDGYGLLGIQPIPFDQKYLGYLTQ
ncbi:MAG: NAD(P)H-binding protein [Candidatus Latescibacteria bacterium]|nr:NAD(P)H-binding protein [Candidatus Latescibacterota bacterium]